MARGDDRARAPRRAVELRDVLLGEDAVADDLAPFIDAAPREEQKYFLATQQVDEARHAVFFKRFMEEVVGVGDGTIAGGLRAVEPELTWGFRKTFALLDEITGALRTDRSRVALARAVTMYHIVVEALLAQPGQHFISDYLEQARPAARLPRRHEARGARRAAPHRLRRQAAARPRAGGPGRAGRGRRPAAPRRRPTRSRSSSRRTGTAPTPSASASRSRRSTPRARARSRPSCARPGCRWTSLPGPAGLPAGARRARAARSTGWRCCRPASSGPATARRRATRRRWSCCSTRSRAPSTTAPRRPARSPSSGSSPTPSRGTCASTTARPRRRAGPGRRTSTSRSAAATRTGSTSSPAGSTRAARWSSGKLRPHGSPRALWAARGLF